MKVGVSGRLFAEIKKASGREILINHCIIHQQNLCAKKNQLSECYSTDNKNDKLY